MQYNILQIYQHPVREGFDYCRFINNAFAADDFNNITIFLYGRITPAEMDHYHGKLVFWELDKKSVIGKIFCILQHHEYTHEKAISGKLFYFLGCL